jgi:hypothetical protein
MRKVAGSFYADWRDEHGKRKMKAFGSAKAARQYTQRMRREVAKKSHHAGPPATSSARGSRSGRTKATCASPTSYARHSGTSRRAK